MSAMTTALRDAVTARPNVVLILADDLGYSDLGCYGAEIDTPHLDALAARGLRLSRFTTTARCSPSRASLLTGLHPHQAGIGMLTGNDGPGGYPGSLNDRCATLAELLKPAGYSTYMSGKWHLSHEKDVPCDSWPTRRGFDRFYGTLDGCGSYFAPGRLTRGEQDVSHESKANPDFFYTDAITDVAVEFISEHATSSASAPFFCYVAYTAPHYPLHAAAADIATYGGRYETGWDVVREARINRMRELGVFPPDAQASPRDSKVLPWSEVESKEWEQRRMEVYAAQVTGMDRGVGRIVETLRNNGQLDNTLLIFLSDNGGCAEDLGRDYGTRAPRVVPSRTRDGRQLTVGNFPPMLAGAEDTYMSYGRGWANVSNAPYRLFKRWVHNGGIASPFIVHWPGGMVGRPGGVSARPGYLPDVVPTILEAAGVSYPATYQGRPLIPLQGSSMLDVFRDVDAPCPEQGTRCYEHMGNAAAWNGRWKLVRDYPADWELYDVNEDPAELDDRAGDEPEVARELAYAWAEWAATCGVVARERIVELSRWGIAVHG